MQIPGSMYFGEMCECNNFQCGVDTRARLCSGKGGGGVGVGGEGEEKGRKLHPVCTLYTLAYTYVCTYVHT